jgi:hypothetical protein
MAHDSAALSPLAGMGRAAPDRVNQWAWGGLLAWRVRFWLLALAVTLVAANSHGDEAQLLARRDAAELAGCSTRSAEAARKFASFAAAAMALHQVRVTCSRHPRGS